MLRSRVSSGVDFARLSQALMRPGIDPRVWVSYAILTGEPVVDTTTADGRAGIFVDLVLLPINMEATARVGAIYAGNGFGLYAPLHKDDEVLVVAPSGDPAEGLVVTQRLWSPSDPPPGAVAEHPTDLTLVVESGRSLRITAQGAGNIYLNVDSGKVYLGGEEGTEPVPRGASLKDYLTTVIGLIRTHQHLVDPSTGTATPSPQLATMADPTDAILATTTEVK